MKRRLGDPIVWVLYTFALGFYGFLLLALGWHIMKWLK